MAVLQLSLLLISAVGMAYQVVLMRVFSIAQWHHFAYMIISIAMLGFGAAGTALTMLQPLLRGREVRWLRCASFLLMVSIVGGYVISQKVPFETFELATQPRQLLYLLTLYVVLAVPFFLVSACITLGFFLTPQEVGRTYFFTMLGSGLGAAGVAGLLFLANPAMLICMLTLPAALAHVVLLRKERWALARAAAVVVCGIVITAYGASVPVRISQYKGLSYALRLPDAEIVDERCSPLSLITAVQSAQIRETPGQISNYSMSEFGALPAQIGLFFDAGAVSPVNDFRDGSWERFTYLDYVTSALVYRLVERPSVLVIGPGGGTDILSALWHGAKHVTGVEVDPQVLDIMHGELARFSGDLYSRPDVTVVHAEGRGYLQSHEETFDLIQLPLSGSFAAAAAGVYALNESYLYTVEAFEVYLARLSARGVLALHCWLESPPRHAVKLFATAVEACERLRLGHPADHLVFVRSWNNATILVSRLPFTAEQVAAVRSFCTERGFDLCHCPGIRADEANRYTVLDRPVYYEAAQSILSPERQAFYKDYVFHIRPATDDRPYFFRFFKWRSSPRLVRGMGVEWIPFVEWGYVALVATMLQSALLSVVLIAVPLVVLARGQHQRGAKPWVLVYFTTLGLAYMYLEIAFIQRFMLFLAYPVYAVAVVLTAFLVFSGLGSLAANRLPGSPAQRAGRAAAGIALLALCYLLVLPRLFALAAGWPDEAKIPVAVAVLAPMAFCMGIPFPTGLQFVSDRHGALLPWAWGVNGCASVIGATLATFTSVHQGFRVVVLVALATYALAVIALQRLCAASRATGVRKTT